MYMSYLEMQILKICQQILYDLYLSIYDMYFCVYLDANEAPLRSSCEHSSLHYGPAGRFFQWRSVTQQDCLDLFPSAS